MNDFYEWPVTPTFWPALYSSYAYTRSNRVLENKLVCIETTHDSENKWNTRMQSDFFCEYRLWDRLNGRPIIVMNGSHRCVTRVVERSIPIPKLLSPNDRRGYFVSNQLNASLIFQWTILMIDIHWLLSHSFNCLLTSTQLFEINFARQRGSCWKVTIVVSNRTTTITKDSKIHLLLRFHGTEKK